MVGTTALIAGVIAVGQSGRLGWLDSSVDRALKPAHDLSNWISDTFNARSVNPELREKVATLRWEAVEGQAAEAENRELRALVSLDRSGAIPRGTTAVTGRVVVRSLADPYTAITVNIGKSDGIRIGDPAVNGNGLIGKVSQAKPHTSKVELITATHSAVSATVLGAGSHGVVEPSPAAPGRLELGYLDSATPLHKGEKVITSGWQAERIASGFPRGLPIGEVVAGSIEEQEASGRRRIRAYANLSELSLVQVLTSEQGHAK